MSTKIKIKIPKAKFLQCYWHLLNQDEFFDIDFLYGGRDSGKSRHTAMQLVADCLREKYFKCLLIRKELNTVRDSQFSLIKSVIEEWGLKHLFRINETRLEITCINNGNGFFGRGLDDVGRIKSFNNPSHCWIEEGNQIDKDDFVVILTSLRAEQRVKTWFTFNPECDTTYTEFWLWQEYFSHTMELSWTWTKTISTDDGPVEFNVRATHTTYRDNPYCKPQRKALYESYKDSKVNSYWYQTYTLGLWGFKRAGNPFWKCFDEALHAKPVQLEKGTIHIVADSNVNPYIAVSAWQVFLDKQLIRQIQEFPCETPNNTAAKASMQVAKWLTDIGYKDVVYVYGDPAANARSTVDDEGRSFFDKFISTLTTAKFKVVKRVQRSAPEVALSGAFINEIYESELYGWKIEIGKHCRKSIEDYTMAREDAEGKILKKKIKDKESGDSYEPYGHFSDDKRYFITTILSAEFTRYKTRSNKLMGY
jgi:phage terminase large subunit